MRRARRVETQPRPACFHRSSLSCLPVNLQTIPHSDVPTGLTRQLRVRRCLYLHIRDATCGSWRNWGGVGGALGGCPVLNMRQHLHRSRDRGSAREWVWAGCNTAKPLDDGIPDLEALWRWIPAVINHAPNTRWPPLLEQ